MGFLFLHALVDAEGLAELPVYGKHGIQAGHGLLEDHGDGVSANVVQFVHGELCELPSLKIDLPGLYISIVVKQAQDAHGGDGFPRAGFSHHAQGFSCLQGVGHVVDSLYDSPFGLKIGFQVFDL